MKKITFLTLIVLCLLVLPVRAQINLLHEFQYAVGGARPKGELLLVGTDYYGLTSEGGKYNQGTIFRIKTDGSGFTLIHSFTGGSGGGSHPKGSLIESGGTLYGMTGSDGGTIFKINPDGSGFAVLHSFAGGTGDGSSPNSPLLALGGALYGTTYYGGVGSSSTNFYTGNGTVFKINLDGSGFALLYSFNGGIGDGSNPTGSLIESGGTLCGMNTFGGAFNRGTIFKLNPDGSSFALIHSFTGGTGGGYHPKGSLIESGGTLFGMTLEGGAFDIGTIFKINPDGSDFAVLHSFAGGTGDGCGPNSPLFVLGGALYGTTSYGGVGSSSTYIYSGYGTVFKINLDGSGFALLYSFTGGTGDGSNPTGSLIESGGTLYGMTENGGAISRGTIFKLNTDGSGFALIHSFTGGTGGGYCPRGSLLASGGALYGVTWTGGVFDRGTIFKMNPDGSGFTVLHSFAGGNEDGYYPSDSLIEFGGTLYGMTGTGGVLDKGTIFKINPDGSGFALIHSFTDGTGDGHYPQGSLLASGGALYGMTSKGGASNNGTIFKINPDGSGFTLLHSFVGADGSNPNGSLIESGGVLYGMTSYGGVLDIGTIFKINTDGSDYALLHSFCSGTGDGGSPKDSLFALGGVLFGMTEAGSGDLYGGTIFKINPNGSGFTLLHSFVGPDGRGPNGSLIESGGALYGMTQYGGDSYIGTIFKINPDGSDFTLLHSFTGQPGDGSYPFGSLIKSGGILFGMTPSGGALNLGVIFSLPLSTDYNITVAAPNGGESWQAGTIKNIWWNSSGPITDVKIELSFDGGNLYSTIVASTPNVGVYSWPIGLMPSLNCYIRISDVLGTASDTSDGPFVITSPPSLTGNSFSEPVSWTGAGNGQDGWYIGDFNGDKRSDLLRYVPGESGGQVFLSDGTKFNDNGSWTGAGNGSDGWYVGDFNGDGRSDLMRYYPGVSGGEVFLSNGSNFIYSGSWTGAGNGSDGWYIGDFNGDGRSDLMRYYPGVSGGEVFLSDGAQFVYSGSWTGAGNGSDGWYVADFNGDGRSDLMRYVPGVAGADVFLSDGTQFVYSGSWSGAGNGGNGWYLGDFNGDKYCDIMRYVLLLSGTDVFLNNGASFVYDGSWTPAGKGDDDWYSGDFNGDGHSDLMQYITGVSGGDVLLSTAGGGSALSSKPISAQKSREKVRWLNDVPLAEANWDGMLEKAFVAAVKKRQAGGEEISIYQIQKEYEKLKGKKYTRVAILKLLKHHQWDTIYNRNRRDAH